ELAVDLREVDQELGPRRQRVAHLELVQRLVPAPARVLLFAGDVMAARQLLLRRRRRRCRRAHDERERQRDEDERPLHTTRTILRAMRQFGSFTLAARLGRGGSAEVWRAVHQGPHGFARTVALKRLLPERLADEKLRASLLDEARLAARLTHPNVAQVLEVVEADGEHAIVMELVDGCDLRTLLKALTRLGPPASGLGAYVAHEVCRALGAAHAARPVVLHRDVSATNVLVSRDGAVKLADFGIGKALEQAEREGTISIKGNLGYMAPEQLTRAPV